MRDIAGRVGVTVPALYYHHANKEAILFALLDTSINRLTGLIDAALADAGDDVEQRFLNLIEALTLFMANSTKLAGLDAEIRSLAPDLRDTYSKKRRRIERTLVDVIETGNRAGVFEVTSPKDSARALLGMIQAVATWYQPAGRVSPRALARKYVDIAAHTIGASAELVARAQAVGDVRL